MIGNELTDPVKLTNVYRSAPAPVRYGITGWLLITLCHLNNWPKFLSRFDPYHLLGKHLQRR